MTSSDQAPNDTIGEEPAISHAQVMRVMYGLMAGLFLAALDQTIVATALPTMSESLGGVDQITWVVTSYLLSTTVSAALWGKLSDLHGRRVCYLAAIGIFVGASLLCGAAQNMPQLIAARALQGIGGGGTQALSFVIMADVLPPRQRGRYVGWISATFAVGSVLGPLVGGFIVDHTNWRWIFLINLPVGLAAMAVAASALRGVGTPRPARLDVAGAITLSVAVLSLLLGAVMGGREFAWGSPMIMGLFFIAAVFAAVFLNIERRVAEPILSPKIWSNAVLMRAIALAATSSLMFQAAALYLPLFLQTVHGSSATRSGVLVAPLMAGMAVSSIYVGRRVSVTGHYRVWLLTGVVAMVAVSFGMATLNDGTTAVFVVCLMILLGMVFGTVSPIVNLSAQNAMPVKDLGAATSALVTIRALGTTLGIAGIGAIVVTRINTGLVEIEGANGLDGESLSVGPKAIAALAEPVHSEVVNVMARAISFGFWLCVPVALGSLVTAWMVHEVPLRSTTAPGALTAEPG